MRERMTINMKYIIIFIILLTAEMIYFRIADKFNIIDKPNQRSSHSSIVLRGGGDYFLVVVVDLERGLRVSVFVVLACGDAGCRCEFHR